MTDPSLEATATSSRDIVTSENSNTNFEVVQITDYSFKPDDSDRTCTEQVCKNYKPLLSNDKYCKLGNNGHCRTKSTIQSVSDSYNETHSSLEAEHQSVLIVEDVQEAKLNTDEISRYESQVLNEPFYESDYDNDEIECCEFITSMLTGNDCIEEISKNCKSAGEKRYYGVKETAAMKIEVDHSHFSDIISHNKSFTSGSYFIDASTLNDEMDIVPTNVAQDQYVSNNTLSFPSSSNYIDYTASRSNNTMEAQTHKLMPFKAPTLQTRYEHVAEFERELKLTEYLQLSSNSRKIKRVDSVLEEMVHGNKFANKESLIVEIKEANNGDSVHSSSCPDNTKVNNDRDKKKEGSTKITKKDIEENSIANENKRSLLIRRNTFELDSNDEKLSILRQEYERRQGSLVFQSAIPQYSGHRVDGDFICHASSEVSTITNPLISFTSEIQRIANTHRPVSYLFEDCQYEINQVQPQKKFFQNTLNRPYMIYPVIKSASDKAIMNYNIESESNTDDVCNYYSNSLPITLNSILDKNPQPKRLKKNKQDETTPIISGGVSSTDYSELLENPIMRRKTESTPIVSGGSVIMDNSEIKAKPSKTSSSLTTWIVDMSNCNKDKSKFQNTSQNMSQSYLTSECMKQSEEKPKNHEKHGSLGFFVNLKNINDVTFDKSNNLSGRKKQNSNAKASCEFYIDISDKNNDISFKLPDKPHTSVKDNNYNENEKKNIFSMFIDLNDTCENNRDIMGHRQNVSTVSKLVDIEANSSNSKINNDTLADNHSPKKETNDKIKPSVFMFIESDSPVTRRRTLSASRSTFKRHSWNLDKTEPATDGCIAKELMFRKEHKRAHSMSIDNRNDSKQFQSANGSNNSLSDTYKAEIHNRTKCTILQEHEYSSKNVDASSVFGFEVKDTPPNSHVEIDNEELRDNINCQEYKKVMFDYVENLENTDTRTYKDQFSEISVWEEIAHVEKQKQKSETFDVSSGSKHSPESDNHDYELPNLLNGTVSDINNRSQIATAGNSKKISETCKSLNETIKKIECELKEPEYDNMEYMYNCYPSQNDKISNFNFKILDFDKNNSSNLVRLSDLDMKPTVNQAINTLMMNDDSSMHRIKSDIPEISWVENKKITMRNVSLKPVSKKLGSVMSTSLPSKQKSPVENLIGDYEGEGIISESDLSSMQSSMGRSGAGTYMYM